MRLDRRDVGKNLGERSQKTDVSRHLSMVFANRISGDENFCIASLGA